jgi:hypothetical protein
MGSTPKAHFSRKKNNDFHHRISVKKNTKNNWNN